MLLHTVAVHFTSLVLLCEYTSILCILLMAFGFFPNLGYNEQCFCNCYCLWVQVLRVSPECVPTGESASGGARCTCKFTRKNASCSPSQAVNEVLPHFSIPSSSWISEVWCICSTSVGFNLHFLDYYMRVNIFLFEHFSMKCLYDFFSFFFLQIVGIFYIFWTVILCWSCVHVLAHMLS